MHHRLLLDLLACPVDNLQKLTDPACPFIEDCVWLPSGSKAYNACWPVNASMEGLVCDQSREVLLCLDNRMPSDHASPCLPREEDGGGGGGGGGEGS